MGAGPAGLALGCYLAQAKIPHLIVEKAHHPRPQVGESLMPATIRILREIGFHDIIEAGDFPRSGGVVYHPPHDPAVTLPYGHAPQEGIDQDYSYHVDRARFDMLLLKHAESLGSKIVEGAAVEEVLFEGDTAVGVRAEIGGARVDFPARIVVDAAGRATRIGRQLGLRHDHQALDQFALHAWCSGFRRPEGATADYTHVYFLPNVRGWAWTSPIHPEITSIGLVAGRETFADSGQDVETFFQESLRLNPTLSRAMAGARRINYLKGEINYSYRLEQVCGNGWLAVGDAARFIDPVFSSGVSVAMHSARAAADEIRAALGAGDVSRERLLPYELRELTQGAIWDDFIRLFYRLLPAFTHLLESREHRAAVAQMIQGRMDGDSDPEVLREMRALVKQVEESDAHPWAARLSTPPPKARR